jgi:competence protein ComEA
MLTKPLFTPPPALTVLAVVILLGVLLNREASTAEALPVFSPLERDFVHVELAGDGLVPGVYQFYDGLALCDVIKMTDPLAIQLLTTNPACSQPLHGGENLRIVRKEPKIEIIQQGWMKASHRVAMTIPLHPDRMSRADWTVLPGVGDALAERLETDRQENGDYVHLEALMRVKGIGKKRIEDWREFF